MRARTYVWLLSTRPINYGIFRINCEINRASFVMRTGIGPILFRVDVGNPLDSCSVRTSVNIYLQYLLIITVSKHAM